MTRSEEQRAYIEATLRRAPEGSAKQLWAEAQLAQLRGGERAGAKGKKGTKGAGGQPG